MKRLYILILFLPFFCKAQQNAAAGAAPGKHLKVYDHTLNFHQLSTDYDPASFIGDELHFTPRKPNLPEDKYGWFSDKKIIHNAHDLAKVKTSDCLPYVERMMRSFEIAGLEYIKAGKITLFCFTLKSVADNVGSIPGKTYYWYVRDIDMPFKKGGNGEPYVQSVYLKSYMDTLTAMYKGKDFYLSHNEQVTVFSPFDGKEHTLRHDEPWNCVTLTFLFYDNFEYAKLHLMLENKAGERIAAVIDPRQKKSLWLGQLWSAEEQQAYLVKEAAGKSK